MGRRSRLRPSLLRREDLLDLRFELTNLELALETDLPSLTRSDPDRPAYIIVHLAPQSIEEEAFFEQADLNTQAGNANKPTPGETQPHQPDESPVIEPLRAPPVRARIAAHSRLVFRIPDDVESIPYTAAGLLNWQDWEPSLAPVALPPDPSPDELTPRPQIAEPTLRHTAIEFPYRLIVSPNRYASWVHALQPVTHRGRTELWHTRLGIRRAEEDTDAPPANRLVHEDDDPRRTLRAIWSPDYSTTEAPPAEDTGQDFRAPLSPNDRHQLVRLTSDYGIWGWSFVATSGELAIPRVFDHHEVHLPDLDPEAQPTAVLRAGTFTVSEEVSEASVLDNLGSVLTDAVRPELEAIDIDLNMPIIPIPTYYQPVPVDAEQFMLSSQGTWAKLRGEWSDEDLSPSMRATTDLSITSWRHVATQGRDHYVRVVYLGYLYPIKHSVSLIKVTERKFQTVPGSGDTAAYLRQRYYIVLRELVREYPDHEYLRDGREMPIKQIRMLTRVTPDIRPPQAHAIPGASDAFWIHVDPADPYLFQMKGRDVLGAEVDLSAGMIYVPVSMLDEADKLEAVRTAYREATIGHRTFTVPRQKIHYAPLFNKPGSSEVQKGDTALETSALYLTTRPLSFPSAIPPWAPHLLTDFDGDPSGAAARVAVKAADQIAGSQGDHPIRLYAAYLDDPVEAARSTIFAERVAANAIKLAADQAGGLATPNVNMTGISQALGPVAGTLDTITGGEFDPTDFFAGIEAKLLGGVDLIDLVATVLLDDVGMDGFGEQFPKMRSVPVPKENPQQIETTLTWNPKVKVPTPAFVPVKTNSGTNLVIVVEYVQPVDGSEPSFSVDGDMTNFDINFVGIINIKFNQLHFVKQNGKKLDVHVDIPDGGISFDGPLKFIMELEPYLSPQQFLDPPSLSISSSGVSVGYSLELPPLAVGVFSLQNVMLGAQLTIPFADDPMRVRFNLSERQDPFLLSVMIFGGGGFFAVTLASGKMEVLEIALEFGGALSLDIGVASGGVTVMAGIYFKLEDKIGDDGKTIFSIHLTAYVRLNGNVSVLGIVNISVEFYLALSYAQIEVGGVKKEKLEGEAVVTVEIEVLFFSAEVTMRVRRRFSGSADDPTFSDEFSLPEWAAYGEAFA